MSAGTVLTRQFNDLVTSTQMHIHKEEPIPDCIFDASVLLDWANGSGRLKTLDGGERIEVPIEDSLNTTRGFFSAGEAISTERQSPITAAFYEFKMAAVSVAYFGDELRRNRGSKQLYDLVKLRMSNAKRSLADLMNAALAGDGSGSGGRAINGLQNLIHISPSSSAATLGSIDPSINSAWRNYADTSGAADASALLGAMEYAIPQISRGHLDAEPSMWLTTPGVYNQYGSGVHGIERVITEFKRGETGNRSYKRWAFKGIPIEYDFDIPTGYMYALPMKYFYFYVMKGANMDPTELVKPHNQDALVGQILWQGQACLSNRRHFGVITGITEATA